MERSVSFAPTETFTAAFGEERAAREATEFKKPSYAVWMSPKGKEEAYPEEGEIVEITPDPPVGTLALLGGAFLLGALVSFVVFRHGGAVSS